MKYKIDLTKGNILKDLLIVAIPTLLTSLIQMAYNLTDMFWISRVGSLGIDSEQAVAAIGTAGFYPWFGFGLIMLAKIGTSVKISQAAGMQDEKLIQKVGNNGILIMLLFGIIYTLFGVFFNGLFISYFDAGDIPNVNNYAMSYMRIVSFFGLFFFMANLFNGVYDGLGKTASTLLVSSSGLILNMILDPIFIFGFGMGIEGAAIATGIGQTSILIIYIFIYMNKRRRPFKINVKQYDFKVMKEIVRVGFFVSVQSVIFTFISMNIAKRVVQYGEAPMAIQRIGSQIESVAWMVASGFQVALASFVGQNFGAKKYDRIIKGYKTSMKLLVPYGIIVNIALFVFAEDLFRIFFSDPETLRVGKIYLEVLSISQLFMIVELATAGVFNGLGKTFYPSFVGILGNLIRIPAAIILGASMGYTGIWWGVSISSIAKGVVLVVWLLFFLRKLGKPNGILFENKL